MNNLKFLVLLFTSLILFQLKVPAQVHNDVNNVNSTNSDDSNLATIYVYRTGQMFRVAKNWAIYVNGERICKLSNNKFIIHKVEPGNIKLAAQIGGVQFWPKKSRFWRFLLKLETNISSKQILNLVLQEVGWNFRKLLKEHTN